MMRWLALGAAAAGAFGCWYDVPELGGASGAGAGAGAGGGSVPPCSASAPKLAVVASAVPTLTSFAATEDGVVGIGEYNATLPCGGAALPMPPQGNFVAHLDATGACTWAFALVPNVDGAMIYAPAIAVDASGSVYLAGSVSDSVQIDGMDTPSGASTSFVLKTDSHGDASGGHGYLKLQSQSGAATGSSALAVTPSGEVTIAGTFSSSPWNTGVDKISGGGFAMHLDASGSPVWAKGFLPSSGYPPLTIDQMLSGPGGEVILLGNAARDSATDFNGKPFKGPGNGLAVKLDAHGEQIWANTFGGGDQLLGVTGSALDVFGDVVVTGSFTDSFTGDGVSIKPTSATTYFFAVLDGASGHVKLGRSIGGDTSAVGGAGPRIAFDASGLDAWIAEGLTDPVNFGCGALEPGGAGDVVLAELGGNGTTLFADRYGKGGMERVVGISRSPSGVLRVVGTFEGTPFPLTIGKTTLKMGPTFIATLGAP